MSIYYCEGCGEHKDGDWDVGDEVCGEQWCETCCCDKLPEDWEDYKITYDMKPMTNRNHDWEALHKDYDPPDARSFTGRNGLDLIEQINEYNLAFGPLGEKL